LRVAKLHLARDERTLVASWLKSLAPLRLVGEVVAEHVVGDIALRLKRRAPSRLSSVPRLGHWCFAKGVVYELHPGSALGFIVAWSPRYCAPRF
jgi:hypothetical protein